MAQTAAYCSASVDLEAAFGSGPDVDFESASPEEIKTALTAYGAKLEPFIATVEQTVPAVVKPDLTTLATNVRQVFATGDQSLFEKPEVMAPRTRSTATCSPTAAGTRSLSPPSTTSTWAPRPRSRPGPPRSPTNEGQEIHELSLARINDGVTLAVDDLIKLPMEEAFTKITPVGGAFSPLFLSMHSAGLSPTIARSDRGLWRLYIEDAEYGSLGYDGHHDWPILQGRYTLAVLFEYAATLGLLDVSYLDPVGARDDYADMWGADWIEALSRYDGLQAVRLNPLGQYAAGMSPGYVPPAPAETNRDIEVLANFDIVATADLPAADRLVLDAYAARTSDRVWTLSAASLLAAADRGRPPSELATFLTGRAAHELPVTVRTLLDDVATRTQHVRDLGMRRIIECSDPAVALLIARDRSLRAHCTQVGDRHLLLSDAGEARFRTAARARVRARPGRGGLSSRAREPHRAGSLLIPDRVNRIARARCGSGGRIRRVRAG